MDRRPGQDTNGCAIGMYRAVEATRQYVRLTRPIWITRRVFLTICTFLWWVFLTICTCFWCRGQLESGVHTSMLMLYSFALSPVCPLAPALAYMWIMHRLSKSHPMFVRVMYI